jgi:hypothetical protein
MAEWTHNEANKTWSWGDSLLVRHGKGPGGKDIYHCYRDGKYIAQASSLEDAKAKCKSAGQPKKD